MTWFLKDDPPAVPDEGLAKNLPDVATQFFGSVRKAQIEGDRWGANDRVQTEVLDEIAAAIGPDNLKPRVRGDATFAYQDRAGYLFSRAAPIDRMAPEVLGNLPRNPVQLQAEVTRRLQIERDELVSMQAAGNAPWTQTLGELAGSLDWYDIAALPIDAPLVAGGRLSAYVGKQALIGAGTSVPGVVATRVQAERLGFDPGDPVAQVAAGGLLQAGLAGVVGGLLKLPEYIATRRAGEDAAKADLTPGVTHEMDTDAAEAALQRGQEPPQPTRFRPDPTLAPGEDPAVQNVLKLVGSLEASRGYDQVSGFSTVAPPRPLTQMTLDDVLAWQDANRASGAESSAAGQFQIIRKTLQGLKDEMGLSGTEVFDKALQNRLAVTLMQRRGLDDWRAGRISTEEFGNNLAQEWASLPVLTGPKAGGSYYAGDGLNGAGTDAGTFADILDGAPSPDHVPGGGSGFTGAGSRRAPRGTRFDEVSTPVGTRVRVEYKVVDATRLRPATGDLQPRDRATRVASDEQVANIAARLDPARLMPGPETDRGAPLVGPDGIIESGNGRVMAINRAAELNPEIYKGYVDAIREAGYDVPEGVTRPVLIAERQTPLDFEGRRQVIRESNTSSTSRMSASEQARVDADYLTQRAFDAYQPGRGLNSEANVGFVRRIFEGMPLNERAALIDAAGRLNNDGLTRIKAALFAQAYDARDLLKLATETETRSVVNLVRMLEDLAPDWAAFRAMVDAGYVRRGFDITEALMETARIIARARSEGRDGQSVIGAIRDRLAQKDLFGESDPLTEALINAFYKGDRARSAEATEDILKRYVAEAAAVGRADMSDLAGVATPQEVLARAVAGADGNTPYAPLPARPVAEPDPEIDPEAFDPGLFTDGTDGKVVQAEDDALAAEIAAEVPGPFGPVLTQFKRDWKGAVEELTRLKAGEAPGALTHPEAPEIALVWGEAGTGPKTGFGLAKIVARHPEVLDDLQGRLSRTRKTKTQGNQLVLESDTERFVISLEWMGGKKIWLLTAFEKRRDAGRIVGRPGSVPKSSSLSAPPRLEDNAADPLDQEADAIATRIADIRTALPEDKTITFKTDDGTEVTRRVDDILKDIEAERGLEHTLEACKIGRARS